MGDGRTESSNPASQAKELFLEALELEGEARARFLAELGRRMPEVCARVESLLAAHEGRAATALEGLGGSLQSLLRAGVGQVGALVGDYELLEEIAAGASGVVWRARQLSLDRLVALKVLRAGLLAGGREVARFRAEAEIVARFHHPHVVPVYEVGEHEGRHFFSMRYYAGGSLAERVGPGRPWEARAAARMVATIARAVHHAHQRGLLHRDLKPSNVLLDEHDAPAVADFGVAAHMDEAGVAAVTATLAGTPAYMAPEQSGVGAAEHGELTVTTDVWALGCILYELLAGRPPFAADTLSGILAQVRDEPPFPLRALAPGVPRDVETIILRCLAKEPGRRYESANALAIDLGRWLEHEPILARRTGPLERMVLAWRRTPVVFSLGLMVLFLLAALAVGASWAKLQLEQRLRASYLGEARATRLSGGQGRRVRALELLAKAAALRPGPDLRDEAIACLATTDLTPRTRIQFEYGSVGPAAVDADLELLAYGTPEGELVVLRLSDREELRRFPAGDRCEGVVLSADGAAVASKHHVAGGTPGEMEIRIWSLASGAELLRVPHSWSASSAGFDPARSRFAAGGNDGRARVWALSTAELELELELGSRLVALGFRGDGGALAVAFTEGGQGQLSIRTIPGGLAEHEVELPAYPIVLAWTADDSGVLVGCADYVTYLVEVGAGEPRPRLLGHRAEVTGAAVSPAQALAATSSWDRTLRLWDLATGEELMCIPATALGFSRDGQRLAYRTVTSFEVADVLHGGALRTLHEHTGKSPAAVAFAPDGRRLVSFGPDGAVLWDLERGRSLGWLTRSRTDGIEFSPDGESLFLSWTEGLERRSTAAPFERGELLLSGDRNHCDLSADGRLFAVRNHDSLELLDPDDPAGVRRYPGYPGFEYVAVGARGTYVAGMSWHGPGISVWRASDGAVLGRLRENRRALGTSISPDETLLVVGDGIDYEVYTLPGLELLRVVPREVAMRDSPGTLAFAEDGSLLALGLTENMVGLYDGRSLEPVARLEALGANFDGRAAFSSDGTQLAISSVSNCVNVWDLQGLRAELAAAGIAWE